MKTIQELILAVQDRISLPLDDDDRWSTTALVNAFNAALDDKLTPELVSKNSNYLVQRQVFPIGSNYPLNAIPIPNRAVGRSLREVKYLPSGKTKSIDEINCLAISLDEKDKYINDPAFYGTLTPFVYIENDNLVFIGGDTTGSIVMYYSLDTSTIENTSGKYATITNWQTNPVATASNSTLWDAYVGSGSTKYVDIYRKSTGAILKANVSVTRSGTTYTINNLSSDEIAQLKVNQSGGFASTSPYAIIAPNDAELLLVPAGSCEFSTIPYEYDQLLVLYVCERVLESLGDTEGLQVTMAKIKETQESIARVSENRLGGEKRKLEDRRSVANVKSKSIQELILDVYDRISKPIDEDPRWTTKALIRLFNNVITDKLAPDLVSEGSNFLIHREVLPLTSNDVLIYPLKAIPLPRRAIGRALREVKYLPSGKTKIDEELNCPTISLEEKDMYGSGEEYPTNSVPYVYFENDSLKMVGGDLTGSIVLYYNLEPSTFKSTVGQFATVTNWSSSTITAIAGASWSDYLTSGNNKFVDIYKASTGAILKANVLVNRSGSTYTISGLSSDELTQLQTNQSGGFPVLAPYESEILLVPAGECEFSTVPNEYDQLLVLYVCERILEALGDAQSLQVVMAKIQETRDSISRVTANRLQGERRKLTDPRSIARIQRGQKWTRNYNKNYT